MITTITVSRQDSGKSVQMAVGDVLEIALVEREPTAGWKAEVDDSVLGLMAETSGESVWLLGDADQKTVRQFRARQEGHTSLRMLYQRIGEVGVATLDEFSLEVTVGKPSAVRREREHMPLPEMVVFLVGVLIFAAAFFAVSFRFGVYAARPHESDDPVGMLIGLVGAVFAGAVAGWTFIRILTLLIQSRFSRGD